MNNSRRINSSSGSPPSVCHELQVEVAPPDARGPGVNLWTATSWPLVIATCLSCSDYRPACQKNPLALFLEPNSALVKATDRLLSVFLHRLRGSESRHRIVRALNNMLSSVTGTRSVCGVFFFFRVRDLVEISDIPFAPLGRAVDDSLMGFLRNSCRGMFFFFLPPPQPAIISRNFEGAAAADLTVSLSPPSLSCSPLRFPGCDGGPRARQLGRPQRHPEQPQLLHEPPADAESQQRGAVSVPLAQRTHQHPGY